MLTNSRHIKRRLEQDGWILDRVSGSHGRALPQPRILSALKNDPTVASDLRTDMVAFVPLKVSAAHAAE